MSNIVDLRITKFLANVSAVLKSQSVSSSRNLVIEEGQILQLICSAAGRPKPEIYWLKDGRMILPDKLSISRQIVHRGDLSILKLSDISSWDSGSYSCRAENINGHIKKWMHLIVTEKTKTQTKPTKSSVINDNNFVLSKIKICESSSCQQGSCYFNKNQSTCRCSVSGDRSKPAILWLQNRQNESLLTNKSPGSRYLSSHMKPASTCNDMGCYSFNDQLFTIFETFLVCLVATLLLGILGFFFRNRHKSRWIKKKGFSTKTVMSSTASKISYHSGIQHDPSSLLRRVCVRDVATDCSSDVCDIFPRRVLLLPLLLPNVEPLLLPMSDDCTINLHNDLHPHPHQQQDLVWPAYDQQQPQQYPDDNEETQPLHQTKLLFPSMKRNLHNININPTYIDSSNYPMFSGDSSGLEYNTSVILSPDSVLMPIADEPQVPTSNHHQQEQHQYDRPTTKLLDWPNSHVL